MKKVVLFSVLIFISFYGEILTQENLSYQKPPKEILELVDFERAPSVIMDEKKEYIIFLYRNTYKSLDDLNRDDLRLGGLRIDPATNISSTANYFNNIKVRKINDKIESQVNGLPQNPKITFITWSPDEKKIAFTNTTQTGVELWYLDVATAKATKLTDAILNANGGSPLSWFDDSQNLLVRTIPNDKPKFIDPKKNLPDGPIVSNSQGEKAQNRTYQDLLKNKTDEMNFEGIITAELQKVNLGGKSELFLKKDMYVGESFSPDGNYILITVLKKPFSYLVPYSRFPMETTVYDSKGKFIKKVNDIQLSEVLPKGFMAVRTGKRNMNWRADKASTLFYVEALDGGDPANNVEFRDNIFTWDAPFNKEPVYLTKTINRFAGIMWGNDNLAVLYDSWYDTRNTKTYIFNPSKPQDSPKIVWDRNSQDIYSDPGNFATKKNQFSKSVIALEGDLAFLIGDGHTKEGQFPFIDEFNTKTFKTNRLYQSNLPDKLESIVSFVDFKTADILVRIESKNEYPNYWLRSLKKRIAPIKITDFKNPFESISNVHKEVIKYKRNDGVELSGTLYLPANYDTLSKKKLPLLIWAYPEEFKDKSSAGQSSSNPNEFTFPYYGSFVYWVTRGYVVLDDASFPIIGEGDTEPNDNFINQLVENAKAAIDAVDKRGYIDRSKVAVGGHSYGAFMTANLLTHSDLFACGIARSGAYNRTLTPFGFQSEQRNYWEVADVYNTMSPFMNAHKMKTPLLLTHGEYDNNPGTFTLQTERYFQALKGLGAPARMVILPKESHGYVAKENILHLLWEQDTFLEKHLK